MRMYRIGDTRNAEDESTPFGNLSQEESWSAG